VISKQAAYYAARSRLAQAKASLQLLDAGAWQYDKQVSMAAVEQAKALLESTKIDLERLTIRALVDGEVLQVNVRPGEFVGTPPNQAMVRAGEYESAARAGRYRRARHPPIRSRRLGASITQGLGEGNLSAEFVRVEKYVVPKKSLTGDNTERVDTRVLQAIYAVEPQPGKPLYVGQQVDVYIDIPKEKIAAASSEN